MPALADISQDVAGPIPVEIIQQWVESAQDEAAHTRILEPFKRVGTMVSSDAAGLSKLTAGKTLLEVMKLVSQPKEIIHAYGTEIGGRPIGVWVADNTQMFYGQEVDPNQIVEQMVGAQNEIAALQVQVGIGIHTGAAFEIGGGLYGAEADAIEEFTEDKSNAQEIIVSGAVKEKLRAPFLKFVSEQEGMHVLSYADLGQLGKRGSDIFYPAPFDQAFHESLLQLDPKNDAELQALHKARVRVKNIVLARIFHVEAPRLLDTFAFRVAANTVVHNVARDFVCNLIKSNGALAIFACDDNQEAVDLTLALSQALHVRGLVANCSVSRGEVLVFRMGNGQEDLAGSPINIASKLAEDTEERDMVFIEGAELVEAAYQHSITETFEVSKSGVTLRGVKRQAGA